MTKKAMKARKTGKSSKVRLTFGEADDKLKINKVSNLKTRDKLARQITKGLHGSGKYPEDLRNIRVNIKGGYSKGYKGKLKRDGTAADDYYHFSFIQDPDKIQGFWSERQILDFVSESMQNFEGLKPSKKSGSGPQEAAPRISEVSLQYIYY